jgi:hypothetical protein
VLICMCVTCPLPIGYQPSRMPSLCTSYQPSRMPSLCTSYQPSRMPSLCTYLFLSCSDLLDVLLELDKYVEPGSTATIFASVPVAERTKLLEAGKEHTGQCTYMCPVNIQYIYSVQCTVYIQYSTVYSICTVYGDSIGHSIGECC